MSRAYSVVAHDYGKPIVVRFRYTDPAAGDLPDVVPDGTPVVAVIADRATGALLVNRKPATIVSSAGQDVTLRYDWASPETAVAGEYRLTFECAATGGPVTLPTLGAIPVLITDDLG